MLVNAYEYLQYEDAYKESWGNWVCLALEREEEADSNFQVF